MAGSKPATSTATMAPLNAASSHEGPAELNDEELNSITQALYQRYRYDYRSFEKKSLARRIRRVMRKYNLANSVELWRKILYDESFVEKMTNDISVGLTSFFRDPRLWQFLYQQVLPAFGSQRNIHLWHAGCATGEEVYSMALIIDQLGLRAQCKGLATDISSDFIAFAQRGIYPEEAQQKLIEQHNIIGIAPATLNRWLVSTEPAAVSFNSRLISHITFKQQNLLTERSQQQFHIIFCRNVLIYFERPAKMELLQHFYQQLVPGGILVLGLFDSVLPAHLPAGLTPLHLGLKVYQKNKAH